MDEVAPCYNYDNDCSKDFEREGTLDRDNVCAWATMPMEIGGSVRQGVRAFCYLKNSESVTNLLPSNARDGRNAIIALRDRVYVNWLRSRYRASLI